MVLDIGLSKPTNRGHVSLAEASEPIVSGCSAQTLVDLVGLVSCQFVPSDPNGDSGLCDPDDGRFLATGRTISSKSSYDMFSCGANSYDSDIYSEQHISSTNSDMRDFTDPADHFISMVCVEQILQMDRSCSH